MKCKYLFGLSLVVFLGLLCGSFIINEKNSVSAVSDLTYTFDSSNSPTSQLRLCSNFGSGGAPSCASYKFLYVSFSGDFSLSTSFRGTYFITQGGAGNDWNLAPYYLSSVLIELLSPTDVGFSFSNLSAAPSGWSATVILSENNPFSAGSPSGSLSITENGIYDVTSYAQAVVEVPDTETIIQGDYHDDLLSIRNCIVVCSGVVLVLYFFYCIYRMIITTTGGRR